MAAAKGNEEVSLNFILDARSERGSIEKFAREWRKEENYRQEIKFKRKSEKWKRENVEEKVRNGRENVE
jgi:hypothetical protein